ncbi:hypothetical protein PAMA_005716 [Pampus argenteus]
MLGAWRYTPTPLQAGEKAIVCDQCGAQFQTEESLEAHRQIHTAMTLRLPVSAHIRQLHAPPRSSSTFERRRPNMAAYTEEIF